MIRRLGICFIILLYSLQAAAIDAVVAHSLFYVPDSTHAGHLQPYVEAYWQVNQRSLHYTTREDKAIVARIKTDIILSNDAGIIKEDHFYIETVPRYTIAELNAHSIIDLRRYFVSTGEVRATLKEDGSHSVSVSCLVYQPKNRFNRLGISVCSVSNSASTLPGPLAPQCRCLPSSLLRDTLSSKVCR